MGVVNVSVHLHGQESVESRDYGQEAAVLHIMDGHIPMVTIYGTAEQLAALGRSITARAIRMGAKSKPLLGETAAEVTPETTEAAAS